MIKTIFLSPESQLLVGTDEKTYGVQAPKQMEELAAKCEFEKEESCDVVDSSGEGWMFMPKLEILSPLTVNKIWSKKAIISFYNDSLESEVKYEAKSLSNKRLSKIVKEIVEHDNTL
jgi:hypothetical protein